jgi:D-3-phosphoglycerate dehydrogenase
MTVNTKRVFFVHYVADQSFNDVLATRPDVVLEKIANDSETEHADRVLAAAHAYQIGSARDEINSIYFITDDLLARAPNLLMVSTNGAGYDTVDLEACNRAGVLAVNQAGGNKEAVAEHALGMMLILAKRIVEVDRAMRRTAGVDRNAFMGRDLLGKTVGIVGLGNVGTRLAELCRGLFKMRVLACDPLLDAPTMAARGAEKVDLDTLLATADYVSINCPRIPTTKGMIGAREFALMRPDAHFVTTARGGIHDEQALARALADKKLAGAGLDVWDPEPPALDHPLLAFDNVVVSPHTAGVTREARQNIGKIGAEQLLDMLDGKAPSRVLNPEVWPAYAARFERIFGVTPTPPARA